MRRILIVMFGILMVLVSYMSATAYFDRLTEGREAVTKDNIIAAVNPDVLRDALSHEEKGEMDKLQQMLKDGKIVKLKGGTHITVLKGTAAYSYIVKIKLDSGLTYWVREDDLTLIK